MKRSILFVLLIQSGLPMAWAYDEVLAKSYQQFYAPFAAADTMKALRMLPAEDFVKAVKAGEKLTVLDVRAPGETKIIGITLPNTLTVSMDKVFAPENLGRIPTDQKVVVVCKGGHRATAIAMALRHAGFDNIYILKDGMAALDDYLSPKTAY
ncbi:MAG: rhodanese-like domain-containing protein [Gallionellaceae bacterium]|nr:rhodanese-like domain-containing protein [Gallionellaceae bacterium]